MIPYSTILLSGTNFRPKAKSQNLIPPKLFNHMYFGLRMLCFRKIKIMQKFYEQSFLAMKFSCYTVEHDLSLVIVSDIHFNNIHSLKGVCNIIMLVYMYIRQTPCGHALVYLYSYNFSLFLIFYSILAHTLSVLKVASLQPGAILNDAYKEYKVFSIAVN